MSGTAIDSGGSGGGKIGNKKFVKGSRGSLLYVVREAVAQAMADRDGELAPLIVDAFNRLHVKDSQIPDIVNALSILTSTNELLTTLTEGIKVPKPVMVQTKVVSCPQTPIAIPGSDSATALESGDTMGNVFAIDVPPSGIIYSATLFDMDYKGIQTDLEIFKARIADVAVDAAYAPSDTEMRSFVTEIAFAGFDDHINSKTSEVNNIGKAYSAPNGKFYIQAVTRGTPTVTAGVPYRVQLQIISDNPDWQER